MDLLEQRKIKRVCHCSQNWKTHGMYYFQQTINKKMYILQINYVLNVNLKIDFFANLHFN